MFFVVCWFFVRGRVEKVTEWVRYGYKWIPIAYLMNTNIRGKEHAKDTLRLKK